MEQMPYQPHLATEPSLPLPLGAEMVQRAGITTTNWQEQLPVLYGKSVTLRELQHSDAPALHALLTTEEVSRFISPPPTTVEGFERFIAWAQAQRRAGRYACFAVVPDGMDSPIGIFQVRALEDDFSTAEWGFALGSAHWGRGHFADGASQVLSFAFDSIGVVRLEARSSVENARGNGALRKVGAVREGTLRRSFQKDGRHHDQNLWVVLASDYRDADDSRSSQPSRVH
jgi:ribosomal-protein-alanine N-acetyltransferase